MTERSGNGIPRSLFKGVAECHDLLMKIKKWIGIVSLASVAVHVQAEWEYLDNGVVRIGVDRSRGACVGYFAESESRRNLLNHFDTGRFIQQSYYGDPDGSDWDGKPWNYNPVQGGSWKNNPSKLLEFKNDSTSGIITAKIMPRSWSGGALCPEAIMEETITLDGAVAHIHFKLTYTGEDQSEARHQEMPAVFVDYALSYLAFMNEGMLERRVPGWPNESGMASEHWTAYLDDKDWGIGILTPGTTEFTSYRFKGDEDVGPEGVACSYVAPVRTLKLTKGLVLEHDVYLTIGWLPEIRERFFQLRKKAAEVPTEMVSQKYNDGRPAATLRMDAVDHGIVLRHGDGPNQCDLLGARDPWVFEADGTYYMHYDAAGPDGWLCSLAVSRDLLNWKKKGPILDLGKRGEDDSKSVAYGITYFDDREWHMFYLGTPNATEPPDRVPSFPYLTMKAKGDSPAGPWYKQKEVVPFRTKPGTFYSITASPGQIVKHGDEFIQFFSATAPMTGKQHVQRTLGVARTQDLDGPWTVDPDPLVPSEEQIENSALYYEKSNGTWFLFTNHIGLGEEEYTDAIWVYWSKDLNLWNPENKAIVLDGQNCSWSKKCIGLPSVVQKGNRLALFYDAPGGASTGHMKRNIGLAWMELPLSPPTKEDGPVAIDPDFVK